MRQQATRPIESVPGRPWWWQWPTILALDAPAVAIAWQWMFARVVTVDLPRHYIVLLGLSVWLAYAADRWIEGWRLSLETVRTQRHYFFLRHRWPAFTAWMAVMFYGIALAVARFTARDWFASVGLLALTLFYVLSHQFLHRASLWRLPKEICVAVIVALGAALYPAILADGNVQRLVGPVALFVLLCLANCLLISEWERAVDLEHGQKSLALRYSLAHVLAALLPFGLLVLSLVASARSGGAVRVATGCVAASTILLALLNAAQPRIGRERARLLADVVLLTPSFVWLVT